MVINPTLFAQRSRQCGQRQNPSLQKLTNIIAVNWADAQKRVIKSYRDWIRAAPEIQTMYSLSIPVSQLRTKIRQEFERNRYVNQLPAVDVLLTQGSAEFQETMNYWKQVPHILKYFRTEEDPTSARPKNFINAFLEARN